MSIVLWKSVLQSQLSMFIKPKQRFLTEKKRPCVVLTCDWITLTNIWEVKSWTTCTDVGWCQICYSFKQVTDACVCRIKDTLHSGFASQFKMAALKILCYANICLLVLFDWHAWQLYGFQVYNHWMEAVLKEVLRLKTKCHISCKCHLYCIYTHLSYSSHPI